ncbi:acyl-CoA dehydrogenase [Actinomycetospora sp. NBRC 106375]|uniref:acyl-CoA dehydrogenase family protein n=1 Tax=Actinomycetospora sp. NBRC 106375 TaxID=3032207 RepID=UPI0024A4CAEF|nr:acyl-CoA dehydrogenase family protein [Actinomycetospora sp. NBRC 106375]GLZ48122.1 acyl-CoA dehydrogenase [Actinomycetospora sp. NBRC 106375]
MDLQETDEHRALRATVRDIAGKFGPRYYVERAEAGEPCTELWQALGDSGFLGINLPEEHGGGGAGLLELAMVVEETAAAGCPLLLLLVSAAISGEVIGAFGTPEQQRTWLPRMASGESKVVFGITEPEAGSNSHRIGTTARRVGDEYVVTGTKHYISGIDEADAVLLVTRTGTDEGSGRAQLSLLIVPTDAPGLVATPLPVSVTLPEKQFVLHFDDVRVPADAVVGEEGGGLRQVFHGLNPERVTGAALCVGIARHVLEQAADYANTRSVWSTPIAAHQGVAHPLAKTKIETELAALMTTKAAWSHDRGLPAGEASNMAKYAAAEAAHGAAEAAIQTHGGNGLATEYGLLPYWGLARLLQIAPVSREMVLNYVAQHSLGLARSY